MSGARPPVVAMAADRQRVLEWAAEILLAEAIERRAAAAAGPLRGTAQLLLDADRYDAASRLAAGLAKAEPPQRFAGAPSGAEVDRMAAALEAAGYEVSVVEGRAA